MKPKPKKSSNKKNLEPFSGIFYAVTPHAPAPDQNLNSKKTELTTGSPANQQRVVLTWLGAAIVMLVIVFFWSSSLPHRLQIAAAQPNSQDVLKKPLHDLKNVWRGSNQRIDDFKNFTAALSELAETAKSAETSSTIKLELTSEQVSQLKTKLR